LVGQIDGVWFGFFPLRCLVSPVGFSRFWRLVWCFGVGLFCFGFWFLPPGVWYLPRWGLLLLAFGFGVFFGLFALVFELVFLAVYL